MLGDVLKRYIQFGLHPLGRICHFATHMQSQGLLECVFPLIVIAAVVLQVVVGRLVAEEGLGGDGHGVFAQSESRIHMSIHLKFAQLISHQTYVAIKAVVDILASVFVQGTTDIGIVAPLGQIDAIGQVGRR